MVNSRAKGKRGELEVVHRFQDHGYLCVRRGDASRGEADLVGVPVIHPEVKFRETTEIDKWMAQAMRDAEEKYDEDRMPVVIHRRSRMPLKVTMLFEDFMTLLGGYIENEQK